MRVIQDSDDESGGELEDEPQKPQTTNASAVQHERGGQANHNPSGTGSTESLKRAFAEAHRNHLQEPSTQSTLRSPHEPQSSVSLPEHPSKKRRTSTVAGTLKSPLQSSSKKGPVSYEKSSKPSTDSSAKERTHHGYIPEPTRDMDQYPNKFWDLPGTVREDHVQHDLMALFPEPSSTIPNATLTQQRILEGIAAPGFIGLNSELDSTPYQPPQASVPWSDLMNLSPANTAEQTDPSDPPVEPVPELPPLPHQQEPTQEVSASQRSRRASSVRPRGSPLRQEIPAEVANSKDATAAPHIVDLSRDLEVSPAGNHRQQQDAPDMEELPQRSKRKMSETISEDDILAIGMPMEQYKPRPSRSRSLKVDVEEPVDYSVRPEKAAKGNKRRKTTGATVSRRSTAALDPMSTPQKVKQICDMGFTPTSTGRALEQNNGDVTQTVDWLITNGIGEDELAHHSTSGRRPVAKTSNLDRPVAVGDLTENKTETVLTTKDIVERTDAAQKPPTMNEESTNLDVAAASHIDHSKSPKVQVVIHSKSPKAKAPLQTATTLSTTSKKAKRRKTTSDIPEPGKDQENPLPADVTTEKKKRGRPKKTIKATLLTDTVQETTLETPEEEHHGKKEIMETTEPALQDVDASVHSKSRTVGSVPEKLPTPATKPDITPPVVTSCTPEQTTKPSSRSPASKGKVSYRVGLSKRAKIAPLLRIVKK